MSLSTAIVVASLLGAAVYAYAAWVDFTRAGWILENMALYGVPESWLLPLGILKAAGALGLLAGLVLPPLGLAAAVGLVAYFIGAIATVLRARCYAHLVYPVLFLLPAAATVGLRLAAR